MLIVAGTFTTAPGERDRVLDMARDVMAATRQEEGCHEYVFSPDVDDPELIRLYELWDGQDELDAHLGTPHIAAWREASAGLIVGRSVRIFTIAEIKDL
ncbi:MAG: antibiotic biosynthesis monooxygenase [Acidimicrobiia bacterium]|nr:antibiotic biosynthesis monooxygenase [Acidimicrobiia bacterium]MDH5521665.1 antibiotic biosynthesis monooxygenase [Acidimicrobiia bacterium]